jgi:hypothetical protein
MKGIWAGGLSIYLALFPATVWAQDYSWRPGGPARPATAAPASPITVTLGRPQALDTDAPAIPASLPIADGKITPASYQSIDGQPWQPTAPAPAGYSPTGQSAVPIIGQPLPVPAPPSPPQISTSLAVAPGGTVGAPPPANPIPPPPSGGGNGLFGYDWLGCTSGCGRKLFESDHCFDQFISPITNPFLFLDPRSQTEVRPIYMFQVTPHSNPTYDGGLINFLGLQASVAITDRLSVIMNKFGIIWNDPKNGTDGLQKHSGISEIWLTPQYTFWRDERCGTIAAAGVIFQIPSGASNVFQDTGTLTVVPYITVGQNFLRDFNALVTFGYALSDSHRAEYFYNSYHLDYDIGGLHRIYPLIELNWLQYTSAGNSRPFSGFEGGDLINFGNHAVSGASNLTLAFGARYKFMGSPNLLAGLAFEFPLIASKELNNFRMTVDFILRY